MDIIDTTLKQFEGFITRSLLPSSSFVMLFLLFETFQEKKPFLDFLGKEHHLVMIVVLIIIFIGISNFLTIFHQFIYDNNIKENYDGKYLFKGENLKLLRLREEVAKTLPKSKYSDYMLYHIIGKKMNSLGTPIDTKRYIDEIKSIGMFFISLCIMIFLSAIKFFDSSSVINISLTILTPFIILILYFLGQELIKYKYRSRAVRIYTNYLDELEKNHKI